LFSLAQEKQLNEIFTSQKDFSGVFLVAEKGKPIYHKVVCYR